MPGWRDFPAIFRHMTVAVYNKSTGGGPDGVIKAMMITRDKLADWGYLYHRGRQEVLEGIRLTGKGFARNGKHLREGFAGTNKDQQFAKLFQMIEPRLYELDGPGGVKPPKPVITGEKRVAEDHAEERDIKSQDTPKSLYPPPK
jgi:hypothetical protein